MEINKKDIIRLLEEIALFLEIKGENPFRISAYRKAAQALERDNRSMSEITDFTQIKGIGKGTAEIIAEYINNGTSEVLDRLKEDIPESLLSLLKIPGLGGKRIAKLYQELEIVDIESLKNACENGAVEQLSGFGKKTVENILEAINELSVRVERLPIAYMLQRVEQIETILRSIKEIERFSRAGSVRRLEETVRDLDFVIATQSQASVREHLLQMDNIERIISDGPTKLSITIRDEYLVDIDFRFVTNEEFITTLHHFTGSKDHNIAMRQLAKEQGEKINEYGVTSESSDEVRTFSSEEAFFNHFNVHYIPPESRTNGLEVTKFQRDQSVINEADIKGDLHSHTTWSDAAHSIEEMVQAAIERGYEYVAITDHSKYLQVANGLNEYRLRKQREEIDRLNETYKEIEIFAGVEMDILPDGSLDFSDDFLKEMDIVIAAIHSSFNQTEEQIMHRLSNALQHPYVDIIAHPTGRLIGRREGYAVDMEALINQAKETETVLEINANPNRFDLSAYWAQQAEEAGVHLAINTDAHNKSMFSHMSYGVGVAKKGLISQETVINTWPVERLKQYLTRNH
ncbi:MAG TPA: DNA polymerase/3'-5' exonuclease PolX [Bacillota bacterium]|nr:DNA polymerase/3'-5' exonuclease PolX [Bacillota bacterium]